MLKLETPTRLSISDLDLVRVRQHLSYQDKKVDYEISTLKRNRPWFTHKYGEEVYKERMAELKAARLKSLLFEDETGTWTYAGMGAVLQKNFPEAKFERLVAYPEGVRIPWAKVPDKIARPYQNEIVEKLIQVRHGGVEVGTGLGKSFCVLLLAKHYGLKTVIMTPSISIADQIYREFEEHFGKKYVGKYGDGRKDYVKLFTVAVAASLARLEPDSEAYAALAKSQVFIADESHLCPAKTLATVCFGLMKDSSYRFFFSGTQIRNDGLDLLLEAITGPIVFRMTVREGVDQGYLARPMFRMVKLKTSSSYESKDPNDMTRAHLYYNENVNKVAASIANQMVEDLGRPVLILIEEMEQFACLLPYLRHQVQFAHGGTTPQNRGKVPSQYHKSNPNALVKEFNEGKFPILIGTSCVSTGTDIQACKAILYIQGGKSEIQVKQCIGRGTRKVEGKTDCFFVDFDVVDCDVTHRHGLARREIYEDVYPDFEEMRL